MSNEIIKNIINAIKVENSREVDLYLHAYFHELLEEYNFNFVHNKIYSRKQYKSYDEDCKNLHILTKGFNYRLKLLALSKGHKLPDELHDAPNSILLEHVSKPLLVNDILNYLHCYILHLSKPSNSRCVNAKEFLKFEDLMQRWDEVIKSKK